MHLTTIGGRLDLALIRFLFTFVESFKEYLQKLIQLVTGSLFLFKIKV